VLAGNILCIATTKDQNSTIYAHAWRRNKELMNSGCTDAPVHSRGRERLALVNRRFHRYGARSAAWAGIGNSRRIELRGRPLAEKNKQKGGAAAPPPLA